MSYVARARQMVREETGISDLGLLDLYTLLVLTHGAKITLGHVHDAWAL